MPIFTRYLYEFNQVMYSLRDSLLDKKREESLFWAYELYHSGFKYDVWFLLRDIYVEYYAKQMPPFVTKQLDKMYTEWQQTGNDLLLGTVVGTLAVIPDPTEEKKKKIFIIMYTVDRYATQEPNGPARNYLKQVSEYPIRYEMIDQGDAYLSPNWLDYCIQTPIWKDRIQKGNGRIVENRVVFETDEDLETFYEKWGFEPDEQSIEMHMIHGIL